MAPGRQPQRQHVGLVAVRPQRLGHGGALLEDRAGLVRLVGAMQGPGLAVHQPRLDERGGGIARQCARFVDQDRRPGPVVHPVQHRRLIQKNGHLAVAQPRGVGQMARLGEILESVLVTPQPETHQPQTLARLDGTDIGCRASRSSAGAVAAPGGEAAGVRFSMALRYRDSASR